MILTHYSSKPIRLNRKRSYTLSQYDYDKPHGFWLSDESCDRGWSNWCKGANFRISELKHATHFKVDLNGWKIIRTEKQFDAFTKKYRKNFSLTPLFEIWGINWEKVRAEYKGILITPYLHMRRFGTGWYYSWDCASGCVWDLSTIKRMRR